MPAPAAHPMAKPGYGKRSAPDQKPPRRGDFDHLPAREAYLASFLDQLCENAAMDAKTIAKAQPLYGQQAVRSGFKELGRAGHLRRVRRRIPPEQGATGTRWVFHTYWSRTARGDAWWARFLEGDVTSDALAEAAPAPAPQAATGDAPPHSVSHRSDSDHAPAANSAAYDALARLGLQDPRLALSSADCTSLEQLAAEWLTRGVVPDHLVQVLAAGLPDRVHSPRAFVGRRLVDKMPPEPPAREERPCPRARLIMECTECRVPGRPEALPGGLCRACRGATTAEAPRALRPTAVHVRAAQVRGAMRMPLRA
ncbi:hypothetical protein [Streptomyces sp. NBC_00076]|uniref:hypothetical protein n=1 Tax=Streptomyces sp. NBC_00076 TaxID=2975642 RepID=UPI003251EC5F